MIDHPRCATCQHWAQDRSLGYIWEGRDVARSVRLDYQGPPLSGTCYLLDVPEAQRTAWLGGGDPDGADLETRADHYCPMHSDLSP